MKEETSNMWKRWGVAFIIGATFGMLFEQQIMIRSIQKDCDVMLKFRIGDIPYSCKQ